MLEVGQSLLEEFEELGAGEELLSSRQVITGGGDNDEPKMAVVSVRIDPMDGGEEGILKIDAS